MSAFTEDGFLVIEDVYTEQELCALDALLASIDTNAPNFRRTNDLFAIRQFLKEVPDALPLICNDRLRTVIDTHMGKEYFIVRSIYFNKPALSNWGVPWHQDMTISVDKRTDKEGFTGWTVKHGQYSVCPPVQYMEHICTIRIHLDDTDGSNGALRVIRGSHKNGIVRTDELQELKEVVTVNVRRGSIMLMRPLLFHASEKSTTNRERRVIHIELGNMALPGGMEWSERAELIS